MYIYSKIGRPAILALFLLLTTSILSGCVSTYIAAAEMAFEDRSGDDIGLDTEIKANIIAGIADEIGATTAATVTVDVYEQVVMLTGSVKTANDKATIGRIAGSYKKVKKIIQEIQVNSKERSASEIAGSIADDLLIENTILAQASTDGRISHTNWRWRSVNKTVYVFGRSLSGVEKRAMLETIRAIDDVKKVVDHSFIRK